MKIITYNVNGIRAAVAKGFIDWLEKEQPDVVCLQEIKAQEEQIPVMLFETLGYKSYFFPAQKKGYSGVAILTKIEPKNIVYGMGMEVYDNEGRFLRVDFEDYSVASIYHPSGVSGDERQSFKMKWLADFEKYVNDLGKEHPNLILCGDYNICHEEIDIHDPVRNAKNSGFLPEEREWIGNFINSGFIDAFRYFNKESNHYTWWSYRFNARANNKGWRIDYCMVSNSLKEKMKNCYILPDALHSDHCPCVLEMK